MIDFKTFVPNNLILSPLAGYTDVGFRYLCSQFGCGLVVTEMVSAMSLLQNNKVAFGLLSVEPSNSKTKNAVQLFGHDSEVFGQVVTFPEIQKFDCIDINMGCPVSKVVRNGEGSALMLNLSLASKIIETTVAKSKKPVTVKFRLGFSDNNINAIKFAQMCEQSGASAITVHGRTKEQMYGGKANWDTIGEVAETVQIPVYVNGDVKSVEDRDKALAQTKAFGVSIGRGSLGKPWLFAELLGDNQEVDLKQVILTHYNVMRKYLPEGVVVGEMKKHVACYLKGQHGSKPIINEIFASKTIEDELKLVELYFDKKK